MSCDAFAHGCVFLLRFSDPHHCDCDGVLFFLFFKFGLIDNVEYLVGSC